MFLLTTVWNPMPSELYDYGPSDLAMMANPRLFSTKAAALAAVQREVDEQNERDAEDREDESEKLRLVEESEDDGGEATWVFGTEHSNPNEEDADYADFVFAYCSPIALEDE